MPPKGLSGLQQVTEQLYISNARAVADVSLLARCRISCVMNVTESGGSRPIPPGVEFIHIPVTDSPDFPLSDHFDEVADRIERTAELGGRTLVHCNAGVSRSAALCLVYLMKYRGLTLLDAHAWLKARRPVVRPNPGFWRQLIQYEKELRGCSSVRMIPSSMGLIPHIYEEETRNMLLFI
ncbi:dual specificity protein phosphatase 18-like [Thalassophryne amazonica]|uniref:dual specificity protein phosphatase 18-like n=1 Tax=Thalassophryne amazonica TaxID=390379 RepID=UPI001471B22E|nr:dual specificity protein phosphatase 18-like [Thalassophryne amazonica]